MHQKKHRLTPLALMTAATFAWSNPALANETVSTFYNGADAIDIYVPPPENSTNGICAAFLEPGINSIIGNYSNNWGILVESLSDGTVLYSHNADKYFIPASNTKLFTTAAALQRLDPDGTIRSRSIGEWITITNQRSNNNYADVLFRFIGGAEAAKSALSQLGVSPNGYRLADGSGLSRRNAATPRAIVSTLKAMYHAQGKDIFLASLPVAGMSGTLRDRMRYTPAQGMVHAKTGTLKGVRALSGYVEHPRYGTLVFSIIGNHPRLSGKALSKTIDDIVVQLSMLMPCE
ncbi:MAG: D-alanyl-D-alanine carboxypeptidase/D-alanyl-D-alanine-endopeptidase [Hydrococcus sp. C42_A2020_068]|uniref:D-alanyl-D-alanine carboxypeptidase/D-alanyl-D-alanine endopeptidase n=1 Tax=Pleurocapsa sp. PCC 7327 TaxID=118163 RepID=UPI00029F9AAE|nr:D-alanyl-D-alanine carboxypeptidase/D-alanyl-D-alanine-endopeptidase [Pleurocapsa sp. PCC 7327]AFY79088.1 D-alanyl-D-alanine carboxypeptidase, serine-type, PBP4 family [Pleurocapsa sp. PCC 7327]MBF2022762.1 D-alanyl-D-alanine carboxypeptidase/D-alanyl-D-alanine-endopeptidase [Hydrococcus sp. C42_A2020_068]